MPRERGVMTKTVKCLVATAPRVPARSQERIFLKRINHYSPLLPSPGAPARDIELALVSCLMRVLQIIAAVKIHSHDYAKPKVAAFASASSVARSGSRRPREGTSTRAALVRASARRG